MPSHCVFDTKARAPYLQVVYYSAVEAREARADLLRHFPPESPWHDRLTVAPCGVRRASGRAVPEMLGPAVPVVASQHDEAAAAPAPSPPEHVLPTERELRRIQRQLDRMVGK